MANEDPLGQAFEAAPRRARGWAGAAVRALLCVLAVNLSACTGHDIEAVRALEPQTGDSYTQTLAEDYRSFALFEADEMYDWIDAGYFANKGLLASTGEEVDPERLEDWRLPADSLSQLEQARARLLTGLADRTIDDEAGRLAAQAQVQFDCWVEQQEENHQWDDIAACRDGFYRHLRELESFLALNSEPRTTPAALPERPAVGGADLGPPVAVALFAFDSAGLDGPALEAVTLAVEQAEERETAAVLVIGHTDRRGSEAYNLDLSLRRAEAVRDLLVDRGIASERIQTIARGEWDPAVPTADGVKEPANRRVEIFVVSGDVDPALSYQETQVPIAPAGAAPLQDALQPVPDCDVESRISIGTDGRQLPRRLPHHTAPHGGCGREDGASADERRRPWFDGGGFGARAFRTGRSPKAKYRLFENDL